MNNCTISHLNIITLLTLITLLTAQASFAELATTSEQEKDWKLVWSDEFEYEGLPDSTKWNYDVGGNGWGNHELEYYTKDKLENARVKDGKLIIEAHRVDYENNEYTSARLVTNGKQAWTYGRFEIRAKLPNALGTWPAIWMLPVDWNLGSGNWPDVGEMDIMEHVGYDQGVVHASMHSKDYQWQIGTQKTATIKVPDADEVFHTYSLEWSPTTITAYLDDQLYFTYENENEGWSKWPYSRDYYLLLNLAVGGDWGGIKGVDETAFPQRMEVEFVRVYQKD